MFQYKRSEKYAHLMDRIMGPNPVKLCEELLSGTRLEKNMVVCDLGSGMGLTSLFMAKEYGYKVYASDLWSDPEENKAFFLSEGLDETQIVPVKADATDLPYEKEFFDGLVCTDSYNYFGRDPEYLDGKLLPFIKKGGYIYLAITGMKEDY
ncbi:MAG: class I SAM-dependent methyltransferase, partial [Spirochaetales bacterium]|nr:class I SAM-dependent methyltransferase [Candidatus Physcosoma equi]